MAGRQVRAPVEASRLVHAENSCLVPGYEGLGLQLFLNSRIPTSVFWGGPGSGLCYSAFRGRGVRKSDGHPSSRRRSRKQP